MRLSILLISYNQQKYLKESLDSIFRQDIPFDYEIIVADDHSADDSVSIIESRLKMENCSYKILPSTVNIGISKNYQRAFAECTGEYIAILEADDYWTDVQRLKKHIAFLDNHQECVMSYNRFTYYFEDKKDFYLSQWTGDGDVEYFTTARLAKGNNIVNLSACVLRNSAVKKLPQGLFEMKIADWMLGMAIGLHGPLARLKDPMSVYRIGSDGEWAKMSSREKNLNTIELIDIYNKFFQYKFNEEFTEHKNRLLLAEQKHTQTMSKDADHGRFFLRSFIRRLIPVRMRKYIKQILKLK